MWRMVVNRLDCIKRVVGEGYEKRRKLLENFLSLRMVWYEEKGLGDG